MTHRLQKVDYSEFTDVQFINRGQFGMVHKAKYKGQMYAIKIQSLETKRDETNPKFKGYETHLRMAELKHDNIVRVMFTTQTKSDPSSRVDVECLVLEFADFCLYDVLHKHKHLTYSPELGMLWALQIVRALDYLHSKVPPIIHRDMKSPNLLLFGDGRLLKITDFGHATDMHTAMTNCAGTVQWMAPEIIKSKNYNETCDIYSFSIILWEILARQEPYSGEKFKHFMVPQFILEIINNDIRPDIIEGIPPILNEIMVKCWSSNSSARPNSASLVAVFEKLCHSCKLVNPIQNKDGHLEQTQLPDSLVPFINRNSISDKQKQKVPLQIYYHDIPQLKSFESLLPIQADPSSIRSKEIFNNHMTYVDSYTNSKENFKRTLTNEADVDRKILLEEEALRSDNKELDSLNRKISELEQEQLQLYSEFNKANPYYNKY